MSKIKEWLNRVKEYPRLKKEYDEVCKNYEIVCDERQTLFNALNHTQQDLNTYRTLYSTIMPTSMSLETLKQMYEAIASTCDEDGYKLFHAAEKILGSFNYGSFYYEDCMGYFEEMDGYGMLRYLEAEYAWKLGDTTNNRWEIVHGNSCERCINLTVNQETEEYQDYLYKLYHTVLVDLKLLQNV